MKINQCRFHLFWAPLFQQSRSSDVFSVPTHPKLHPGLSASHILPLLTSFSVPAFLHYFLFSTAQFIGTVGLMQVYRSTKNCHDSEDKRGLRVISVQIFDAVLGRPHSRDRCRTNCFSICSVHHIHNKIHQPEAQECSKLQVLEIAEVQFFRNSFFLPADQKLLTKDIILR